MEVLSISDAEEKEDEHKINVFLKCYYAVFYDDKYYVGCVIEQANDRIKIKFLKNELDQHIWPKTKDVACVQKQCIFYGSIDLLGTIGPFRVKRYNINIEKNIYINNYKYSSVGKLLNNVYEYGNNYVKSSVVLLQVHK